MSFLNENCNVNTLGCRRTSRFCKPWSKDDIELPWYVTHTRTSNTLSSGPIRDGDQQMILHCLNQFNKITLQYWFCFYLESERGRMTSLSVAFHWIMRFLQLINWSNFNLLRIFIKQVLNFNFNFLVYDISSLKGRSHEIQEVFIWF